MKIRTIEITDMVRGYRHLHMAEEKRRAVEFLASKYIAKKYPNLSACHILNQNYGAPASDGYVEAWYWDRPSSPEATKDYYYYLVLFPKQDSADTENCDVVLGQYISRVDGIVEAPAPDDYEFIPRRRGLRD